MAYVSTDFNCLCFSLNYLKFNLFELFLFFFHIISITNCIQITSILMLRTMASNSAFSKSWFNWLISRFHV